MQFWTVAKIIALSISLYFLWRALKKVKAQKDDISEIMKLSENLQMMTNIGGWQVDIETQKSIWTTQTYKIHEIPEGTPTGVAMGIEFYTGDDKKRIDQAVHNCILGIPFREVLKFRSAKGTNKWVECAGEPVYNNENKLYKLRGTIQDVTESVNLKNQLSLILNHSPAAVYECLSNKNWTMKYISSFIEKLSGYPSTDFINDQVRSYASIIHPEDLKFVSNTISKSIESLIDFDINYRIITKSGEIKQVWERGSFESSSGNLIGIIFDQTEQKSVEQMLTESQKVAKLGNWSFDLKTQEIKWSQQMYQLFPENPELGPPSFEKHKSTIHPDDQERWSSTVNECIQNGTPYKFRFRVVHPDKTVWLEAIGKATKDPNGNIIALNGTGQDVTETVQIEESLNIQRLKNIQTAKLASLGEMSAGVAHEINNPLAIVSGNLQILLSSATDNEKLNKKLEVMLKATERIAKIVHGLKKFARMSDQNERKPQLLYQIVQETLYILEIKAKMNHTQLTMENTSQSLVFCNQLEIEQVIINLVTNSLDAIKNLNEKWIIIRIFDQGHQVILQVEDSGLGISASIESKLFDPFFTTKPVGEGTGLGLSITKGILDDHKAEISLNKSSANTCFEIRFPVHIDGLKNAI